MDVLRCVCFVALGFLAGCMRPHERLVMAPSSAAQPAVAPGQGEVDEHEELPQVDESSTSSNAKAKLPPVIRTSGPPMVTSNADGAMTLSADRCGAELARRGVVFRWASAEGVAQPVVLQSAMGGVWFTDPSQGQVLDCRLALQLSELSSVLRRHRIVRVVTGSLFRKNAVIAGQGTPSQHRHGLAIDIMGFVRADGLRFTVLRDWNGRIGANTCVATPGDSVASGTLRAIVCEAASLGQFHTMLTPNFNAAHRNHLHFDIKTARRGLILH